MKLLLDTHVLVWFMQGNKKLSDNVVTLIEDSENVYISAASFWELSIKQNKGLLTLPAEFYTEALAMFQMVNINAMHALYAPRVETPHKDPFDKMLIEQANYEKLTLITADENILNSDGTFINATIGI